MKRFIDVHNGEITAGQGEVILKSDAETACLIIAAYDPMRKIGALAHAQFNMNGHLHQSAVLRDPVRAVDEMIDDMKMLGSVAENIEISVVAGENVKHHEDAVYHENINRVLATLKDRHIRFRTDFKEDIGMSHVALDVESGEVLCK